MNNGNRSRDARQATLKDGVDDSIEALSSIVEPVHHGIYIDQPGGGEARIPADDQQRFGLAQHHTGTHLLHEGLRQVLGNQIQQAGSLVDINRLRFDFTYHNAIEKSQLIAIEDQVNEWISESVEVMITEENIDQAKARGAHAMFGEKYADQVRVVDIPTISIELCGGNHVMNTEHLESFKILSDSAVAAGTRRIEALVGKDRINDFNESQRITVYKDYKKRWDSVCSKASSAGVSIPNALSEDADISIINAELEKMMQLAKSIDKEILKQQKSEASMVFEQIQKTCQPLKNIDGVGVFQIISRQSIPVLRFSRSINLKK